MSAASSAAAMISPVLRIWSATGPMGTRPPSDLAGPVRCWGAAEKMWASSWAGLAMPPLIHFDLPDRRFFVARFDGIRVADVGEGGGFLGRIGQSKQLHQLW